MERYEALYVILFTRDYGRLSVISKGARKLKNINSAIQDITIH